MKTTNEENHKQIGLAIVMLSTEVLLNMEAKVATRTDGYSYTVISIMKTRIK